MKKYSLYNTAICVLLAGFFLTACEKEKIGISSQDSNLALQTKQETTDLAGTKWKLIGFVSNQNQKSNMIEAEPKCDRCYTLVFDTDSTALGYSIINIIRLDLKPVLVMGERTEADDSMNGNVTLYYEAMKTIESYIIENDTLKFFYNNNDNYLLFKLIEQ